MIESRVVKPTQRRSEVRTPVIVFIFIILAYAAMRYFVYSVIPQTEEFGNWIVKDTIMDVPRLICGSLALGFGLWKLGKRGLGFLSGGLTIAAILFIFDIGIMGIDGLMRTPYSLSFREITILSISSFVVAFNEELLFRGLGISALKAWRGDNFALWSSTFLFTVFHYSAQPLSEWPAIFFFGLLMGQLRLAGVSLYWLILYHGASDSMWFWLDGLGGPPYRWVVYGLLSAVIPLTLLITGGLPRMKGLGTSLH